MYGKGVDIFIFNDFDNFILLVELFSAEKNSTKQKQTIERLVKNTLEL